jgi:hypothetical protein
MIVCDFCDKNILYTEHGNVELRYKGVQLEITVTADNTFDHKHTCRLCLSMILKKGTTDAETEERKK